MYLLLWCCQCQVVNNLLSESFRHLSSALFGKEHVNIGTSDNCYYTTYMQHHVTTSDCSCAVWDDEWLEVCVVCVGVSLNKQFLNIKHTAQFLRSGSCYYLADSRLVPSQWETSLQSNAVSHWLGSNQESAMLLAASVVVLYETSDYWDVYAWETKQTDPQ